MFSPCSSTLPALGASSPPKRCSSVLLPEPEAPTMASVSPACTCRSTPCSTCTSSPPSSKRLLRPWQRSTISFVCPGNEAPPTATALSFGCSGSAASTGLFIAQRLGRVDAAGAPARVQRGREGQQQRNDADRQHVVHLRVTGHAADEVDAAGQEADAQHVLDGRHDDV